MPSHKRQKNYSTSVRWWPAALVILSVTLAIGVIWLPENPHRQDQIMQTGGALALAIILLLAWLLFLSRLHWKIRLISFAAIVVILSSLALSFQIRGVSGDLLPILEWRWGKNTSVATETEFQKEKNSKDSPTDYPQFLGPTRNATLHGIHLTRDWIKHPPRSVWRQSIGAGWSAFAVSGNSAITQEQHGDQEMVVCYNLKSGHTKWSHSDKVFFESTIAGNGPRATPTIKQGRVYSLGATGILNCLDLITGQKIWSKNIVIENKAKVASWGMSGSPLVVDSLVVVSPGGAEGQSLVAYHQDTGEAVWSGGNAVAGYSSPLLTTIANIPQILIFNRGQIAAHHPATGKMIWDYSWPKGTECVAQPVVLAGDRVFISSGYGIGCRLLQIKPGEENSLQAALIWETRRLKAKFTNVVYHNGYIYGLDDGVLVCLDLADTLFRFYRKGPFEKKPGCLSGC